VTESEGPVQDKHDDSQGAEAGNPGTPETPEGAPQAAEGAQAPPEAASPPDPQTGTQTDDATGAGDGPDTAPEETAPEETAPEKTSREDTAPEDRVAGDTAPEDTVLADTESSQTGPHTEEPAPNPQDDDPQDADPQDADAAEAPEPEPGADPEAAPPHPEPEPEPGILAAAEPEPEPGPPCAAGLFGKLPARGDFISRAIAQDLLRPFEDWLLPLVQNTRALLGDDWTRAWRQAPPWRFWIGPDILRGEWTRNLRAHEQAGTVTGVMLPSADRQGRLFPLVVVLADDHARLMPPPVLEPPDRRWYGTCDRLLYAARDGATLEAVEADLARLHAPRLSDEAAQMAQLLAQRSLWGQGAGQEGPDGHEDVWSGIRASDHHLAATGRSYWWCETPRGATSVITLAGLPDPATFAFMLTDAIPADPPQTGA
jgi:type VI secretion system protein ImpM